MGDGSSSSKFPAADIDSVLDPGSQTEFKVDPVSSQIAQGNKKIVFPKNAEKKSCCEREDKCSCTNKGGMYTLKKSLMASGVIMALAAAAFVVTKKMQERSTSTK